MARSSFGEQIPTIASGVTALISGEIALAPWMAEPGSELFKFSAQTMPYPEGVIGFGVASLALVYCAIRTATKLRESQSLS